MIVSITNIDSRKARNTFAEAGIDETIERGESAPDADVAVERGKRTVLADGLACGDCLDVIVEATGVPSGARHVYRGITKGKHVVNAIAETDTVVGPVLADLADKYGVIYSLAYGDQPALMIERYGRARTL